MVEASSKSYKFTDKASTEKWLVEHSIEFNVSNLQQKLFLSLLQTVEHEAVFTMEDMKVVKFEGAFEKTHLAKNLFFADKKKKERMWLICAASDTKF
jgi:hypothetical protein